jgi:hypothetical protein
MITTTIEIEPYLSEYIKGKFGMMSLDPVTFPDNTDLYHVIFDLVQKRPSGLSPIDQGNLEITLPCRRIGKNPEVYNYLSQRAQKIISKRIKLMFDNELHERFEENYRDGHRLDNIEIAFGFLTMYGIESITEDALLKNYYRWRDNCRKRQHRRKYNKSPNYISTIK